MAHHIKPIPSKRIKDQTGRKVGRLTVIGFVGLDEKYAARWLCRCDCSGEVLVTTGELTRKQRFALPKSCGCSQIQSAYETHTKHGMHETPEYAAWSDMKGRCTNPNDREWKRYGERGIRVCDRWMTSFEAFFADMGLRPSPDHSLERQEVNGNYEPSNCVWVLTRRQQWNRRDTIYVNFKGERLPLGELAFRTGISRYALRGRIVQKGMTAEHAVAMG